MHLVQIIIIIYSQLLHQFLEPLEAYVEVFWVLPISFLAHFVIDEEAVLPDTKLLGLRTILGHLLHLLQLFFREGVDEVLRRDVYLSALFVLVFLE